MSSRSGSSMASFDEKPRRARTVDSYIASLDGSIHPALNTLDGGVIYDQRSKVYVAEPPMNSIAKEAETEAKLFAAALLDFENEVPKEFKTGVDPKKPHSIKEVVAQIDQGIREYKGDDHGIWQNMRKGFYKLSETQEAIDSWLKLLPDSSEYFSLLCGGLKLILKAAGRIGDVRNKAFDALADMPYHLMSTQKAVNLFDESESLRKCGVQLYVVSLKVLDHILAWFKKRAIRKGISALLRQSSYEKELQERIEEIVRTSTRFKEIAVLCHQQVAVTTGKAVESLTTVTGKNFSLTNQTIALSTSSINRNIQFTQQRLQLLRNESEEHNALTQAELAAIKLTQMQTVDAVNHLTQFLKEVMPQLPNIQVNPQSISTQGTVSDQASVGIQPHIKISSVLEILKQNPDHPRLDLESCLRSVGSMKRPEQDRAVWAMKSVSLHNFVTNIASGVLIMNNNGPRTRTKSPMTFVCARLVNSLKAMPTIITMQFFCGQHIDAEDDQGSPLGMVKSLLAQLLTQYPDFEISEQDLAGLAHMTIEKLLTLFCKMVSQIPYPVMVFCVIDGITLYEDPENADDTRIVMEDLAKLTAKKGGCAFKLLLTSATKLRDPPETVDDEMILNVPKHLPPQGGFTANKWADRIESEVEALVIDD